MELEPEPLTADLDRTDPHDRNLGRELHRLHEARADDLIADADYEAIIGFWKRFDRGESARTTQETHLSNLRKAAERLDGTLIEADADDLGRLMAEYKSGSHPDVKDSGLVPNPHQAVLRVFYRWHSDLGVNPEDIDINSDYSGRDLSPADLWTADDVDAWLDATRTGGNLGFRDRAWFTLALATGQRIDAIRSLRVKHITEQGPTMDLTLNEDDGQLKGASGTRPVLWAKHHLRPWLENHPFREDPEAGLFCVIRGRGRNRLPEGRVREPLDGDTLRGKFRDTAKDAGIQKPTYFHILRHTALTRMALSDLPEQRIKYTAGWDPDSSQFSTYVHLADELTNDSIRESLDLPTSGVDHPVIGRPTVERCPECKDQLPEDTTTCTNCGEPLTYADADADADASTSDNPIAAAILDAADEHGQDKAGDLLADAVSEVTDALED